MKAVIPVAGVGTKLRPHTHTQPKPLIPVAGKPILGHIIDSLIAVGITKQVFIIGYLKGKIRDYVVAHYHDKIEMEFVVQEPRRGLAHALWFAREEYRGSEEIVVLLGDTIFGSDLQKLVDLPGSVLGVHHVDDPREFGIAVLDDDKYVRKLVEKPEIPTSNLALVGMYKIDHIDVFIEVLEDMVKQEGPSSQEFHITDAFMKMIERGIRFSSLKIVDWFDCGRKQSLLETNRILLENLESLDEYEFTNSVIIHPVKIAPGCYITDSIIGPYVAIAENAVINQSIIRNTILGAFSTLEGIILNNSVIGNDTTLRGKSTSVNIGDNTEIDFDE